VSGVTTTKVVRLTSDLSSAAWTSDEMTGQNISPVTCIGGRVYTGTFTNKNGGMYRCIDAASGETKWTVTNDGGFYWCGAASVGGRVIFGSDDGNIYSVSETAEDTSDMKTTDLGDCSVRCAPAVSGGAAYITTKSESGVAKIYKLGVSADGTVSDEKSAPFGDSVNTPVIFDGNIFVGNTSGEVAAFSGSLEKKASVKLDGPVQGRLLVSGDSGSGYSVCACCNAAPGGISLARFSGDLTRAENRGLVYAPAESQYCISPVTEADGVLYYKNDSNTIFAVKKAAPDQTSLRGLKALSVSYQAVRVSWTRRDNVVSYEVYRALSKNGKYTTIKVLPPSASYFTNTGLSCGRPYYYKVRAKLRGGKYTAIGNPVSAVPVVGAPRLNTYAGTARVTLRWTKAYGASGYKVFRSTSKNGKYKYVRTTRSNAWVNSGLARKRVYFYKVRPYRKCGRKLVYGKWSNISYKRTK
ncbi:MAG: PQQ-binding-like beta-propeller repeat protein, partial [Anaerovoracaceae bacterium]|nr:PQQ-binding-like beta-propeller repeat protein [Anaerovoracaceae bacterium]